jgi:hypothetical protein
MEPFGAHLGCLRPLHLPVGLSLHASLSTPTTPAATYSIQVDRGSSLSRGRKRLWNVPVRTACASFSSAARQTSPVRKVSETTNRRPCKFCLELRFLCIRLDDSVFQTCEKDNLEPRRQATTGGVQGRNRSTRVHFASSWCVKLFSNMIHRLSS